MRIELTSGVHLTVIPTTQFKTTRIAVHFLTPLAAADVAGRTLLTSLLETSSQKYPTSAEVAAELERLYGANFGIGVGKEGDNHRVTATLSLLADHYAQAPLLTQALQFLKEILFFPLLVDGVFEPQSFAREQANLISYIDSMNDDRQYQASRQLQRLYFLDEKQAQASFGTQAGLAAQTPASVWQLYQQMVTTDQVEIVVLGAVEESEVQAAFQSIGFMPRMKAVVAPTVDQVSFGQRLLVESAAVNQAKLNLGYHVPTGLYDASYYANLLAIELFGASPLSLLFTNVREKASLAYYASASFDPMRSFMMVQTGIDGANATRVRLLIEAQRQAIVEGRFDHQLLQVMKDGVMNNRQAAYDSPRFLNRQAFLAGLLGQEPPLFTDYQHGIQAVDVAAIQQAAAGWQLQAQYLLKETESQA